jgi:uncharacterized protein YcbX
MNLPASLTPTAQQITSIIGEGTDLKDVTVRELWTYPVKCCQDQLAQSIEITEMGVVGDRGFAIWADGRLEEQKLIPRVASIGAERDLANGTMLLRHDDHSSYEHQVRDCGSTLEATWVLDNFTTIDQG